MNAERVKYGFYSTKLWKLFETKTNDTAFRHTVELVCKCATDLSRQIVRFFPTYTIHDGTHITGVCEWMYNLVGEQSITDLSVSDIALLVMSASCHDIGMAVDDDQKVALLSKLSTNKEEVLRDHVRKNHHVRVDEQLEKYFDNHVWDDEAMSKYGITKRVLADLCKSHGEDIAPIRSLYPEKMNLNICAVLLRLADALDYDSNRAPEVLVKFLGLKKDNANDRKSYIEHKKTGTGNFVYHGLGYPIRLMGICNDEEIYDELFSYVEWLDRELFQCNSFLANNSQQWINKIPNRATIVNLEKKFADGCNKGKKSDSICNKSFNAEAFNECINGLLCWTSSLKVNWGALSESSSHRNANTAEGLLAYKITGYYKKKSAIYRNALIALMNEAKENGWQSITLKKETVQCTALALFLFSLEREMPTNVLKQKTIDYDKIERIAIRLWNCRNPHSGWGHYVEFTADDECNNIYTGWALIALSRFRTVANTPEFTEFCQLYYERSFNGKLGYYDSNDPQVTSTSLFVCLLYLLPKETQIRIREGYNLDEALDFILRQMIDNNVQVEPMQHGGEDSLKAPWYNITVSLVLSAVSLAYNNGDLEIDKLMRLHEHICNRIIPSVYTVQTGKVYQLHGLPTHRNKKLTYPSFHLIWGLKMFLNSESDSVLAKLGVDKLATDDYAKGVDNQLLQALRGAINAENDTFT